MRYWELLQAWSSLKLICMRGNTFSSKWQWTQNLIIALDYSVKNWSTVWIHSELLNRKCQYGQWNKCMLLTSAHSVLIERTKRCIVATLEQLAQFLMLKGRIAMHSVEERPLVLIKAPVYHHNWCSYKSFEPLTLVCTDKHCTVSSFICSHKDLEKATTNSSQFCICFS